MSGKSFLALCAFCMSFVIWFTWALPSPWPDIVNGLSTCAWLAVMLWLIETDGYDI